MRRPAAAAGARRRLLQLRDKVRRDPKLSRETTSEKLGRKRSYSAEESSAVDVLSPKGAAGKGLRARDYSHDIATTHHFEETDSTLPMVRVQSLLADCFRSTVSLALASAATTATLILVWASDPGSASFWIRFAAVFLSLASLISHLGVVSRCCLCLARAALSTSHASGDESGGNHSMSQPQEMSANRDETEDRSTPLISGKRRYLRRWRTSLPDHTNRTSREEQKDAYNAPPNPPVPDPSQSRDGLQIVPLTKEGHASDGSKSTGNTWSCRKQSCRCISAGHDNMVTLHRPRCFHLSFTRRDLPR